MGGVSKEEAFRLLDAFHSAGGNFIDTAGNYQEEQSERNIGEWMELRGNRDEMFVATKFAANYRSWEIGKGPASANFTGNSRKTLHVSVRDSLRKLRTDYVDLLLVHLWDYTTGVAELMDSLHIMVEQGKVLYLGVSNTPAWVVAEANTYAAAHGKTPFSVYQCRWNVLRRDPERDIIPMAHRFGMALMPWDALGTGKFQSRAQLEARLAPGGEGLRVSLTKVMGKSREQSGDEARMSEALEEVAGQVGEDVTVQQVALAYVRQKAHNVFPIVGGRKVEYLEDNIKALSLRLTDEQVAFLEGVSGFDVGYPQNMIGPDPRETDDPALVTSLSVHADFPRSGKPLRDH
jgi:aryl-alcohol dehydrogenase-like predicted oxidoreductase